MQSERYIFRPALGLPLEVTIVGDASGGDVFVKPVGGGGRRRAPRAALRPVERRAPSPAPLAELPNRSRPPMAAVGMRRPRFESEELLDFVRAMSCAWCGARAPSEPHHWPSRGAGGHDTQTVPLCGPRPGEAGCHREFHDRGQLGRMTPVQTRAWLVEQQVRVLTEYLRRESDAHG